MIRAKATVISYVLAVIVTSAMFLGSCSDTISEGNFTATRPSYVFVTSTVYDGNLGGLDGANEKCNDVASASGHFLGANFMAWISTSSTSPFGLGPIRNDRGYINTNGQPIAISWDDLINGTISTPIKYDENGIEIVANYGSPESQVWTGTLLDGTFVGEPLNCANWTSNSGASNGSGSGSVGSLVSIDANWSGAASTGLAAAYCNEKRHLYCFEISPVFAD